MPFKLRTCQRELLEAMAAGDIEIEIGKYRRVILYPETARLPWRPRAGDITTLYFAGALIRRRNGRYVLSRYGEYLLDRADRWAYELLA